MRDARISAEPVPVTASCPERSGFWTLRGCDLACRGQVLPSGLKATLDTPPVCPRRGSPSGWRVPTSHSTVPSTPAEASVLPSGHPAAVPAQRLAQRLACRHIPQHGCDLACRGQRLAVRAEGHARHSARVPAQGLTQRLPLPDVPQPHRSVIACRGQHLAVRAKRHAGYAAGMMQVGQKLRVGLICCQQ